LNIQQKWEYKALCNVPSSGEFHRITEGNSLHPTISVQTNEPLPFLLKHTLTITTMLTKDSIQTRFGSVGLPTTIKQSDKSITHLSNTIAMKKYKTHTILVGNHGVVTLPIFASSDSGIHQSFDLPQGGLRLVDLLSMAWGGGRINPQWTPDQLSHVIAEVTFLHASPPGSIRFIVEHLSNILTEIITFCHAIVEPHVIIMTINNVGVEVIQG